MTEGMTVVTTATKTLKYVQVSFCLINVLCYLRTLFFNVLSGSYKVGTFRSSFWIYHPFVFCQVQIL